MSTSDILLAYAIILIFGLVFFYSFIIAAKSHIAKHWDEYKCSPMITPFSSYICPVGSPCQYTDPSGNVMARPSGIVFSKCIQDSQAGQMETLLAPIFSVLGSLGSVTKYMNGNMSLLGSFFNSFQQMFGGIVNSLSATITNVMAGLDVSGKHFGSGLQQSGTALGLFGNMGEAAGGGVRSAWNAYPGQFIDAAGSVGK